MKTEFTHLLGEGVSAEVYGAHDKLLRKLDRIKAPNAKVPADWRVIAVKGARDPGNKPKSGHEEENRNADRNLRSVRNDIAALCHPALRGHPNIVSLKGWGLCLDTFEDDPESLSRPLLILERAHNNLQAFIEREKGLKFASLSRICLDIGEGLEVLHMNNMAHGDLKTLNVLVFWQQGRWLAKLCDFGLTRHSEDVDSLRYFGSEGWRPPEACLQDLQPLKFHFDLKRCDIWAYGLILWSVFAGAGPEIDQERKLLEGSPEVLQAALRGVKKPANQKQMNFYERSRLANALSVSLEHNPNNRKMIPWEYLRPRRLSLVNSLESKSRKNLKRRFRIRKIRMRHRWKRMCNFKRKMFGGCFGSSIKGSTNDQLGGTISLQSTRSKTVPASLRFPSKIYTAPCQDNACSYQSSLSEKEESGRSSRCHHDRADTKMENCLIELGRIFSSAGEEVSLREIVLSSASVLDHEEGHCYRLELRRPVPLSECEYWYARLRSRLKFCCWLQAHGQAPENHLRCPDFRGPSVKFSTLAWLCRGEIGNFELQNASEIGFFQPSWLWSLNESEKLERFLLLLEHGYRIELIFGIYIQSVRPDLRQRVIAEIYNRFKRLAQYEYLDCSTRYYLLGKFPGNQLPEEERYATTALHDCAQRSMYEAVEQLIRSGVVVNALDIHRKPALHYVEKSLDTPQEPTQSSSKYFPWKVSPSRNKLGGQRESKQLEQMRIAALLRSKVEKALEIEEKNNALPLGWDRIPHGTYLKPIVCFVEPYTGSTTFRRPQWSPFSDRFIKLPARRLEDGQGDSYVLDLIALIDNERAEFEDEISHPLFARRFPFYNDSWFEQEQDDPVLQQDILGARPTGRRSIPSARKYLGSSSSTKAYPTHYFYAQVDRLPQKMRSLRRARSTSSVVPGSTAAGSQPHLEGRLSATSLRVSFSEYRRDSRRQPSRSISERFRVKHVAGI